MESLTCELDKIDVERGTSIEGRREGIFLDRIGRLTMVSEIEAAYFVFSEVNYYLFNPSVSTRNMAVWLTN
jgi:hypothetical protein